MTAGCKEGIATMSNRTMRGGGGNENRTTADGAEAPLGDEESEEWARLRCSSIQTEVISERNRRNRQPSAGYPGLAFGSSLFSSGSMMKFRVIANELHNIMNVQLKRAEGEVSALHRRVQVLEEELVRSEDLLVEASHKLEAAGQEADESERIRLEMETCTNVEDGRITLLQTQLGLARHSAEEFDRRYLEMTRRIANQETGMCQPRVADVVAAEQ